jgi:hypothetical protein
VLVLAATLLSMACGGGSGSTTIQPKQYTVTITAATGALEHSTVISLAVQ